FQSLLYCIFYWKLVIKFPSNSPIACFNPSYTGCATGSVCQSMCELCEDCVSILLMLDVLLEVGLVLSRYFEWLCFNPSYTGCATGRRQSSNSSRCLRHVSILLILDVLLEDGN